MHVLDWGKIAESSLIKRTQITDGSEGRRTANKGILFEDVIEKLLAAMFPEETWRRTGESHDGKRDFVYPAEVYLKEQKWAECKNYNSNLSLNVIAPTLIMGAIKGIECIFFFSYSPLNDTTIENLLRYSEMEQSVIKIFDGNLLESLICKYHAVNGLEEFFPNTDFERARAEIEKTPLRIIKTLRDLNGNKVPLTHRFELGESFYYHITIQNLMWKPMDCELTFQAGTQQILWCVDSSYRVELPFAEIKGYSVLCQALSPGSTKCTAKVTADNRTKIVSKAISVIDEPYLAWSGENALRAQECGRLHLSQKETQPLFIVGQSGTGKSTLAEILLQQKQVQESYQVLKVDLTLTRNVCMRNLLSQILGIQGKEITPKEQTADDEAALALLVSAYAESAAMIVQTMMRFYNATRPYLFVIDDVQKITRPYISLIQELDAWEQETSYPIHYLFTLNEEETSLDELLARLNWDKNYQNRKCRIIRMAKFKKKDVLTYMKTRYGLEDIDPYFDGFDKEISPLELHSFCAGLRKERVIAQIPGRKTYQIIRPFQFSDALQQMLYAEIPLKNICNQLDKGGQAEFLLKYLYVADELTPRMVSTNTAVLQGLIDQGVLREKDGVITFYHDKIRAVIGKALVFSEEDYADIFADHDTDDITKAVCSLEGIDRLRNGSEFLKQFFTSNGGIKKGDRRYQICTLIIQHLSELSSVGLSSTALRFVRAQFPALWEEQGYKAFLSFLKSIADFALAGAWDIDEECTENTAFFIKKFFDRTLSTYHDQNCLYYFPRFEKIFKKLVHISEARRNFWLAHYANRTAIAIDRRSTPLTAEPTEARELYELSEFYSQRADHQDELILQIIVDNFNRHYVYRHDLTSGIISDSLEKLRQLKDGEMADSIILNYHLLLLEYLDDQMTPPGGPSAPDLLERVRDTRQISDSAFYITKLYFLELVILANCRHWKEANECLSQALAFAYKKEMRPYIYKLTYIRSQLIIFEKDCMDTPEVYQQAVLALEQMIDTHGDMIQNLKRESFLLVRLLKIITQFKSNEVSQLIKHYSPEIQNLIGAICMYIQGDSTEIDELLDMKSFLSAEGVSFPIV